MPIRLSGISSGLDTDAIVKELVSVYQYKIDNVKKDQTKLSWKQDAWKTLNNKIYTFYSKSLSTMRFSNAYNLKTTASSDTTKATVSASSTAVNSTQKLNIDQVAQTAYLTGGVITTSDGSKVTESTTMADLGISDGDVITVTNGKGETTEIELTADLKVSNFVAKLKTAGLNASFDENNKRFFISAKESGEEGNFELGGSSSALMSLGLTTVSSDDVSAFMNTYGTEDAYVTDKLDNALASKISSIEEEYTNLITTRDNYKKSIESRKYYSYDALTNTTVEHDTIDDYAKVADIINAYDDIEEEVSDYNKKVEYVAKYEAMDPSAEGYDDLTADYDAYKAVLDNMSDEDKVAMEAKQQYIETASANMTGLKQINGWYEDSVKAVDNYEYAAYLTSSTITTTQPVLDDDGKPVLDEDGNAKEEEVTTTTSTFNKDTTLSSGYTGTTYADLTAEVTDNLKAEYNRLVSQMNSAVNAGLAGTGAVKITGQDSIIRLNDALYTSATNNFTINGLTITALAETEDDAPITISTATDTKGLYDKIKSFLTEYNTLINEMDSLYNAASSKGYEPLTDDEKDAMSETEVEKWETKIKDSLLRRDSTLSSVSSLFRTSMLTTFEIEGYDSPVGLSTFGIKTGGYFVAADNEKNAFHIDGDSDDSITSDNADKLMAALSSDPDSVIDFMTKLCDNMYSNVSKKMATSTEYSSMYTIYNDKQLSSQYEDYDDEIDKWEEKMEYYENYYYSQFTAMETALAKLEASSSSLASLMGMS